MYVSTMLKRKGNQTVTTTPETQISTVVSLLESRKIGAVIVADSRGKVRGILSERDIVRGLSEHGAKVMSLTASDLMSPDVISCRSNDTISDVMAVMTERNIRHLPVVEAGRLLGMVSMRDVVRERLTEVEADISDMMEYMAGGYSISTQVGIDAHAGHA